MSRWLNSLFIDHAVLRIAWRNWGVVEPGQLYRSNHPLPWQFAAAARRHGLASVINLRGQRMACGSDALGRAAAARLGLVQADQPLESRGAPHPERLRHLMHLYRTLPRPILIHCKSGADRAGLAAAVWRLMHGQGAARAAEELSWRYGHVAAAKTGILDAFVAAYAPAEAAGIGFEDWLDHHYDRDALAAAFRAGAAANFLTDRVLRRE